MNSDSKNLVLEKLNAALQADSDFPTRAQIITELRKLTSDTNTPIEQIVELVMCEPSLASRLLHLTNSVYFGRGSEITTLSQGIAKLGLKGVYNLCANFVLLQRFSSLTEKSNAFSNCFLISLLTSNIAAYVDSKDSNSKDEEGYLAGSLFSLGPLLLGFYFPKLFTEAEKRSERKKIGILKGVEEILGIPANGVSLEIINSLSVPQLYKEILEGAYGLYLGKPLTESHKASKSVCLGALISEAIVETKSAVDLKKQVEQIAKRFGLEYAELLSYLTKLPNIIHTQKTLLETASCNFPEHFVKFIKGDLEEDQIQAREEDSVSPYFSQIETAILESETIPSIIATAMEALSYACDFQRVIYLETDTGKSKLIGKLGIGENFPDLNTIVEDLQAPGTNGESVHLKAFFSGMIETYGKPLLEDSWPYVAIPVGYEDRALGVIYADSLLNGDSGIPADKTITLTLLSDLLDSAIEKSRI